MDESTSHEHGLPLGGSDECLLCPICVVLQALTDARPEVAEHLLRAARELALAVKAGVEAHAEAVDRATARAGERLQRIRVD